MVTGDPAHQPGAVLVYNGPQGHRSNALIYDEKRHFIRSPAVGRMTYRLAGDGGRSEGWCVNLSGSGILFTGPAPLEVGKAAELHLISENRITPPLTLYIEVVRSEPAGEGGGYEIAGAIQGVRTE